jgi:protein-S-isoprenylcysteine O-methyltransferase Ste14
MAKSNAIIASYVGVLAYAGIVFLGAWKLVYWQGLLYLALALVGTTVSHLLMPAVSTLTADRAETAKAGQAWDKRILGVMFLLSIVTFFTAGLDSGRYGWTGPVPPGVTLAGSGLMVVGQILFAVAKRQNAFFSSTVRIQSERGHRVCDTGLYGVMRHPGYLGMLLSSLAFPLVMNAYWAFMPTIAGAAVLIARTVLEDQFLHQELPGYADYALRTRWMLVPGLL